MFLPWNHIMAEVVTPEIKPSPEVKVILDSYLELGRTFKNPPEIKLSLLSQTPPDIPDVGVHDIAVTTAVQCYAPGNAQMKQRRDERSLAIAESTLHAGHLTTRQHAHFTWHVQGASRSVTHDVFHWTPFYNTEQQSQRYVEAKAGNYLAPEGLSSVQEEHFTKSADFANAAYFELLGLLDPEVSKRMHQMYPPAGWNVESTKSRLDNKTKKICQEVARYALPIGQKTTYYHTLSQLQLQRLFRSSQMQHFSDEARYMVAQMIESVAAVDPTIYMELEKPLEVPRPEVPMYEDVRAQKEVFDDQLMGRDSKMIRFTQEPTQILVEAARVALGIPEESMEDEEILELLVDPKRNRFVSDVYDVGMIDPLTSALRQVQVTFIERLSHTADSQRQRHRRTPGVTPPVSSSFDGSPDYITPLVVRGNTEVKDRYEEIMSTMYENVNKAISLGIPQQQALLLLPNAHALRVVESGDLFDWAHRLKQRLCLLAQEEIFFISVDQAEQIVEILPDSQKMMLAPCGIRKHATERPRCPEGDRWCGQPVFHWQLEQYKKARLI